MNIVSAALYFMFVMLRLKPPIFKLILLALRFGSVIGSTRHSLSGSGSVCVFRISFRSVVTCIEIEYKDLIPSVIKLNLCGSNITVMLDSLLSRKDSSYLYDLLVKRANTTHSNIHYRLMAIIILYNMERTLTNVVSNVIEIPDDILYRRRESLYNFEMFFLMLCSGFAVTLMLFNIGYFASSIVTKGIEYDFLQKTDVIVHESVCANAKIKTDIALSTKTIYISCEGENIEEKRNKQAIRVD